MGKRDVIHKIITCTENFVKFERVVFEICERTDIQTDRHADTVRSSQYLASLAGRSNDDTRTNLNDAVKSTVLCTRTIVLKTVCFDDFD